MLNNHFKPCVSSKTVLQNSGQFRTSEWNVICASLAQLRNDDPQSHQRFVDIVSFTKSLAAGTGLRCAFGAGQIDQVEVRHVDDLSGVGPIFGAGLDDDPEDSMGPD